MATTEQKVADTILQKEEVVLIGGASYNIAPPSTATLILVSAEISKLPKIEITENKEVLPWVLSNAKDCGFLGDIVAILILGAKGITETRKIAKPILFGFMKSSKQEFIDHKKILAKKLLEDYTPKELYELAIGLFDRLEIGSFFGITTFLIEINLTKPTREVVTTASGQ